jgi:hypothetical protein
MRPEPFASLGSILALIRVSWMSFHGIGWLHTLLSNFEQFIRIPSNYTAWYSAPAPFDHACEHLQQYQLQSRPDLSHMHTIGSNIRSSWARVSPRMGWLPSKKWRTKVRTALGSEVGRKGSSKNGRSSPASRSVSAALNQVALEKHCDQNQDVRRTSGFEFFCGAPDEFLNFFGLDAGPSPCIFPFWLR